MERFDRGYRFGYDARRPGLAGWWERASPAKIFLIVFLALIGIQAVTYVGGLVVIVLIDQVADQGMGVRDFPPHSAIKE